MVLTFSISTDRPLLNARDSQSSRSQDPQPTDLYRPKLCRFKRHENLALRGSGLWRIQQGYVRSLTWSLEGDPVPLGFWGVGDIVGYAIAQAHPYEMQCLTSVTAEYLGSACRFSPAVALAHVRQSNELLRIVHCRQTEQRLLSFLCWLAYRFGERVAEGYQVQPKLTHQEIADSIGSTRVTVTRLLQELERGGKIRWNAREKIVYTRIFEQSCESLEPTV
ncbi:MAG: Crp/Fnr family transcriptional regulator [Phormidesmis sp. RL_2_1]|nr:Crp/Fnr family transcriptional regulator [Phormidesmis sp. RL_2_1]